MRWRSHVHEVPDISHFREIEVQKPAEIILQQLRALLVDGTLKPGMRLPSERKLAERFGVGRGPIREALKRLEFYGILKTLPQRGTVVASLGVKALEGLISNLLSIEEQDVKGLLETRAVLEAHSARCAAERATESDLSSIRESHEEFESKILRGEPAIDEDHVFHLRIAHASKNRVLMSLISLITPDVISMNKDFRESPEVRSRSTLKEHERVFRGIFARDPDEAEVAMSEHMRRSIERRLG